MNLWICSQPLILASTSQTRRHLLASVGIPTETCAPGIDERQLEHRLACSGATPAATALGLAEAKALAVSTPYPDRLIVAADQTLSCGEQRLHKAADTAQAADQLRRLSGKTHHLHSGICCFRNGKKLFDYVGEASMTMRDFSDDFLQRYIATAGSAVTSSVGAYQIEGLGLHLFESIEGDHFTILGLPLMPLLAFLRTEGALCT